MELFRERRHVASIAQITCKFASMIASDYPATDRIIMHGWCGRRLCSHLSLCRLSLFPSRPCWPL